MEEIIRNVRDIDAADRKALEHMAGRELRPNQQVIIRVLDLAPPAADEARLGEGRLPDWCNVYEGLTDEEIAAIEASIVRSRDGRSFE
jgi:hypothetical protein